jgi:uncharacterized lipoprotein YmbA
MRTVVNLSIQCGLIILMAVTVFGCRSATPPANFYTLTPMPMTKMAEPDQTILNDIKIGIGPLRLPKVLERPQIVTRPSPSKLELAEFQRWGGYLSEDFLNVVTENISILIGTNQVLKYPWPDKLKPTYRIEFDVHQFDGRLGDSVLLKVTWILRAYEKTETIYVKRSIIEQPVSGKDYDALIAAQSKALETFSRLIVDEVKKITQMSR